MKALTFAGEGTSEEEVGGSGELVLVTVVQAEKWQGSAEASVAVGRSMSQNRRRGKGCEGEVVGKGGAGEKLGRGGLREVAEGRVEETGGALGAGKRREQGAIRAEKTVDPDLCGPGLGGCSSAKSSPGKSKLKGSKGLSLGPGCCWGPGMVQGGQGGTGEDAGGSGLVGDEGGVGEAGGQGGPSVAQGEAKGPPRGGGEGRTGNRVVGGGWEERKWELVRGSLSLRGVPRQSIHRSSARGRGLRWLAVWWGV